MPTARASADVMRQAIFPKCKGERRGRAQQQYVGALASAVGRNRHRRRIAAHAPHR